MTGSVTFDVAVGGDGSTVTDDDNTTTGLRNGGWRTRFVPCFTNQVSIANFVVTKANAANTSATNAAASATAAAASYDSFDDRYLGSKASDPTFDNDGNALLTGALYWNSTSSLMKAYSGSAWVAAYLPAAGYLALSGGTLTGALAMTDQILSCAMFKDVGYTYYNSGTTNALDYVNGSHQRWTPNTGAQTLSITNWPPTSNLGELLIEGVNLGAATITWPTINWIKSDGTTTTTFSSNGVTLQTSGTDWVILWTRDAGTTIYGKVIR